MAWDIHVHAAPSLFPRWGDGLDLVRVCQNAGMKGIVLKSHHGSTTEQAYLLNKSVKGFHVYGGLTLNYFVGGLNPFAVDAAIQLGAKIIWLPTIHAAYHAKTVGPLGGFSFQEASVKTKPKIGISVLNKNGELGEPIKEILQLLHKKSVVLATGHISPKEILAIHDYRKKARLNFPLLINHVFFNAPSLSGGQIKTLADRQTWFELVYLSILKKITRIDFVAAQIREFPRAQWILASDSGQKENPLSPKALNAFSKQLLKAGIARSKIQNMLCEQPQNLLDL